jgi:hypothetical protein
MTDARLDRRFRVAMALVAGVAGALYLGFVYGYPHVFELLDDGDPRNYRRNVAEARARGDLPTARRIAQFATRSFRLDPAPYALYAEVLLETGATAEARRQLETAVALTTSPAPESRPTRLPYFHPRARLILGQIAWREGDVAGAAAQFELARPLADLRALEFEPFHEDLFETYAAFGAWSRAVEFGMPTVQRLGQLDRGSLVAVMAAAEGIAHWELLAMAGRALLSMDTRDPAGQFAVGRAALAQERHGDAVEPLTTAAELGHPHAAFFLGLTFRKLHRPNDAAEAFRETPQDSMYWPFALAVLFEHSGSATAALHAQFEDAMTACCPLPLAATPDLTDTGAPVPLALGIAAPPAFSTTMPVLVRWLDPAADGAAPVETALHGTQLVVRRGNEVLQLQWAANMLPFGNFELFELGTRSPAGWLDPGAAWTGARALSAGEVVASSVEPGRLLQVTSATAEQPSLLYSVPAPVRPGSHYVLWARMHAPDTKAVLGWEFLDEDERVVIGGNAVDQSPVPEWAWKGITTKGRHPWKQMRVVLGIYHATGQASFDDVALLELTPPRDPD